MSRIGNLPIEVGDKVKVDVASNNMVTLQGPKGQQAVQVDPEMVIEVADGQMIVKRPTDQQRHRSLHGLYRSLLYNAYVGVTEGYRKELEIIGVGYRAQMTNGVLELALGYSHPIYFLPPEGISINVDVKRGKNTVVLIEGADKQMVGQVAAKIRGLRPPEPYKGKGVRYVDEYVRRKAGKTAAR